MKEDTTVSDDNTELKNSDSGAGERSTERSNERELSGGRQDRSRELLREELTRNLDDAARRSGRPRDWEPEGRPAREAKSATDKAKDGGQETAGIGHNSGDATPLVTGGPPTRWVKEAKAEWEKLPKTVQDAVAKGEADVQKGVDSIKQKYAAEDAAWAPYEPALRQASVSRSQAISNFMSWHQYLQRAPLEAFPALVKSVGAEPAFRELLQRQQAGGQQADDQDKRN
jgi:hypothetical protein